mmetsp:Transcript_40929/g.128875  ORF Transcript_40929/g.128875 Transcript_40929/m.128875 type:complete len:111 (-) Transcript_40929:1034-1366(-)
MTAARIHSPDHSEHLDALPTRRCHLPPVSKSTSLKTRGLLQRNSGVLLALKLGLTWLEQQGASGAGRAAGRAARVLSCLAMVDPPVKDSFAFRRLQVMWSLAALSWLRSD